MEADWIGQQFDELKKLAEERFGQLGEAEDKMLRAAISGERAWCGPSQKDDDPLNNPSSNDEWGKEREIRAEVIRWLSVNKTAEAYVDPRGIWLHSAKISSRLNLNYASVRFPLVFLRCRFSDPIRLVSAELPSLNLQGSSVPGIVADGARFGYSVFLGQGFCATGEISLWGVQIKGALDCAGGTFKNPPQENPEKSQTALKADLASVRGHVRLCNGFVAEGSVSLNDAQIDGLLDCRDGSFKNPLQAKVPASGTAFSAARAKIKGGARLNGKFMAEGLVNLWGVLIEGALDCSGGLFKSTVQDNEKSGTALLAERASIKSNILLCNGFVAEGNVSLMDAQIDGVLECRGGTFKNPAQAGMLTSGKALSVERARIKGGAHLRHKFMAEGLVNLWGVQIEGVLDCEGGSFKNLPQTYSKNSGTALLVANASVKGAIRFCYGFVAEGLVNLWGVQIDGVLNCSGGLFRNPPQKEIEKSGTAILAEHASVKSNVLFNQGFISEGRVNLVDAQIDGILECQGGRFKNPLQVGVSSSGAALGAVRATIKGGVNLRYGFIAEGQVSFAGAQIDGNFDCGGGIFKNPAQANSPSSGIALSAENVLVRGGIFLRFGLVAEGKINLLGASVGGDLEYDGATVNEIGMQRAAVKRALFWRNIKNKDGAKLDLLNAAVGSLVDAKNSWPNPENLHLDGFTYGRIAGGPKDSKSRLEWVGLQKSFSAQPYRQLAKILREEGDDEGARRVLYEMEKRKHKEGKRRLPARLWNPVFQWTIGYGIYPRRAVWWLLLLVAFGWAVYRYGYFAGVMTPTNKETYSELHDKNRLLPHYQHFYASVYSAENSFPLVNLGQKELWSPDPNQQGLASVLRVFRWIQVLLGWALATFFVAGVTGIARKE